MSKTDTWLAVESAMYGYDWTLNRAGHRLAGTQAATVSATDLAGEGWMKAGSKDGETHYRYTAGGQRHSVGLAGTALEYQAAWLRQLGPGCAVMAWAAGKYRSHGILPHPAGLEWLVPRARRAQGSLSAAAGTVDASGDHGIWPAPLSAGHRCYKLPRPGPAAGSAGDGPRATGFAGTFNTWRANA
jgi:hypothetical protein